MYCSIMKNRQLCRVGVKQNEKRHKSTHPTGDEPGNITHAQIHAHQHMAKPRTHKQFGFHPYKAYECFTLTQTILTH